MSELITIIVPVYNVEDYLPRCIESLILQKYSNIEILLINDGSLDNSLEICRKYAEKDIRIKVFDKVNGGVSSARNVGLENASGKYVMFVDSDDYVSKDYCQNLYNIISDSDLDVVCTSHYNVNGDYKKVNSNTVNLKLTSYEALKRFLLGNGINCYLFSKIFNHDCIENLRFNESLESAEDILFIFQALKRSRFVCINNNIADYYYVMRDGSLTHKKMTISRIRSSLMVAESITKNCEENTELEKLGKVNEISLKGEILEWLSLSNELQHEFRSYYGVLLHEIRCYKIFRNMKYLTYRKAIRIFLLKINPKTVPMLKNFFRI